MLVTWSSQPLVSLCVGPIVFLTFVSIHCWLLDPHSYLSPLCQNFSLIASLGLAHIAELIITATFVPCVRLACPLLPSLALSAYTADLHSHLSPLCAFVSIHCWSSQPLVSLVYLCQHTLLVTWSSQPLRHLSPSCETGLSPVAFLTFVSIPCCLPDPHSLKSPMCSFISIHCWLPGAHSLKSPLPSFISIHCWLPGAQSQISLV